MKVGFDERLREISLGSWDGRDRREIRSLMGKDFTEFEWYFRTPDGENYDEFAGRIAGWLDEVGDGPVIAVCHGVVTRVLRGLYAGMLRPEHLPDLIRNFTLFQEVEGRTRKIVARMANATCGFFARSSALNSASAFVRSPVRRYMAKRWTPRSRRPGSDARLFSSAAIPSSRSLSFSTT